LSESTNCSATAPRPRMPTMPHIRINFPGSWKMRSATL